MALRFDGSRSARLLIIPPLFEEANRFRRQIVETMRELDRLGIDSCCPDLPGCNESLQPMKVQTLAGWRTAVRAAADHFGSSHALGFRSGCWLIPDAVPAWLVAPAKPQMVLRGLLRARTIAAREAGRPETAEALAEVGRREGIELAGWQIGAPLFGELESGEFIPSASHQLVEQAQLGGKPLWLRAENDDDPAQVESLVAILASGLPDA